MGRAAMVGGGRGRRKHGGRGAQRTARRKEKNKETAAAVAADDAVVAAAPTAPVALLAQLVVFFALLSSFRIPCASQLLRSCIYPVPLFPFRCEVFAHPLTRFSTFPPIVERLQYFSFLDFHL